MRRTTYNLPPRKYYRIDHAAELLGCSSDDLIHWAAQGYISVCAHASSLDGIGAMNCRYVLDDAEEAIDGVEPSEMAGYEITPDNNSSEYDASKFAISGWWELTNGTAGKMEAQRIITHNSSVILRPSDAEVDSQGHTPWIVLAKATQEITIKDLVITQTQLNRLKNGQAAIDPPKQDEVVQKPLAKQTENNLHAVVAALAKLYTKTDCSKPYEAAETILQAFTLHGIETVKKDALAGYIQAGNERTKK